MTMTLGEEDSKELGASAPEKSWRLRLAEDAVRDICELISSGDKRAPDGDWMSLNDMLSLLVSISPGKWGRKIFPAGAMKIHELGMLIAMVGLKTERYTVRGKRREFVRIEDILAAKNSIA